MVYLVLKYTRVPAVSFEYYFFAVFIQTLNEDVERAIHNGLVTFYAKAPFKELCGVVVKEREFRIDDHVKGHGRSSGLLELLRRQMGQVLRWILDHCQLNRHTDLRRRQPHARRLTHRDAHQLDQFLYLRAADLIFGKLATPLPQDRISSLDDL